MDEYSILKDYVSFYLKKFLIHKRRQIQVKAYFNIKYMGTYMKAGGNLMRVSTDHFIALIKNRISEDRCLSIKELCEKLQDVIWRNTIVDAVRNYTDHKLEHSYRVLKRALEITDNAINCSKEFKGLSENEISILCFSALLHDICMSAHPKMEMDRNIMNYFEPMYRSKINIRNILRSHLAIRMSNKMRLEHIMHILRLLK